MSHKSSCKNRECPSLTKTERAIFDAISERKFLSIDEIIALTPSGINGTGVKYPHSCHVKTTVSNINKKIKKIGLQLVNYRWLGYSLESLLFKENLREFGLTTTECFLLNLFLHKGKLSHEEIVGFLDRREPKRKVKTSIDRRPSMYSIKINGAINAYGLYLKNIYCYGYELCNIQQQNR